MSKSLFHITSLAEWQEAQSVGEYKPEAFAREQFIHCSYRHQLLTVANRFYHGQDGLVVLLIDSTKINSKLIEENLEGGTELYPHLYGVLPTNAVSKAIAFPCNADGNFSLPIALEV